MDTNTLLKKELLFFLQKNPETSVKKLAEHIGKSEKTTRTKLTQLNDFLQEKNFGSIEKTPGKGVKLKLNPLTQNQLTKAFHEEISMRLLSHKSELELTYLLLAIKTGEFITQIELAEQLYVSIPTFRKILKKTEAWLSDRRIQVQIITGKGLTLLGDEFSKRVAIRDAILLKDNEKEQNLILKKFAKGVSIQEISDVIRESEGNWKIKFSNESFTKILIMLTLSISRFSQVIKIPEIPDFEHNYSNEYSFVETVYRGLEKRGFGPFNEMDKKILTTEILVSNKLRWKESTELTAIKTQYDKELVDFVQKIISSISEILRQPLLNDKILQEELTNHLHSAIFRMKYGRKNSSELSRDLKKIYTRVFLSVWSTSQLFEDYYNVQLTEEEITYIVLYIESAILRNQSCVEAYLITDQGRSQSLFVSEVIKKNIPEIKEVHIIREEEINAQNCAKTLYLATMPVKSISAVQIAYIPTDKDLAAIRHTLSHMNLQPTLDSVFSEISKPLLDPHLIFVDQEYQDKEAILRFLCDKMENAGVISPDFYSTVWNRELKTTTCIGYKTAIPHGSMTEVFEPKVAIMVLKKPILWFEDEVVDTIFLLATRMSTPTEIRQNKHFYRELIALTEDDTLMAKLKASKSQLEAFNYLFLKTNEVEEK